MPWEVFKPERKPNLVDTSLKGLISIRKYEIAVAMDLVEQHWGGKEKALILINQASGEMALRPGVAGHTFKQREGKSAYVFSARAFLATHPIKKGRYTPKWDGEKLIIQVWTPEKPPSPAEIDEDLPQTSADDGAPCPVCGDGILEEGACDKCGFDEAEGVECPKGLVRPFEKPEICKMCLEYKRAYGNYSAKCKWDKWVEEE